jgi:glycosyltransferase involved in cell wall biosynthesis
VHSSGRYAVIATRDRPAELAAVVEVLHRDGVHPIVVDNGSTPPAAPPAVCTVIVDGEQPPNLSRLWNVGLETAAQYAAQNSKTQWDVAVVNDDAVIPGGWFDACATAMRYVGAAAACSDPHGRVTAPLVKTRPDRDVFTRMCGWAFVLRGEAGMRFDEQFRWWWGDSDMDVRARTAGGMVVIPGYPVGNLRANSTTTGVLAEQAGRDRAAYAAKHGSVPW